MTLLRGRWLAVLLAPIAIVADGPAFAAGGALPHGIHLARNGRYVQDVCDRDAARHCYSSRLLPEGFVPHATPLDTGFCSIQQIAPAQTKPYAGTMGPVEIQTAYAIPATTGAHGKIVAVVDMPDATAFTDLTAYRAQYGLPTLPQCTTNGGLPDGKIPCFAALDQTGAPFTATAISDCKAADPETGLDIEMISAACPDCSILLVQMTAASKINGPTDQDFLDCTRAAALHGAEATSISFGGAEEISGPDPIGYTKPGHLVVAASGDQGYLLEGVQGGGTSPSYPASAPDVLGVGGTLLQQMGAGSFNEVVWNDDPNAPEAAGSGCSIEFARPAYQTAFGATKFGPSCTRRASSDVSAAASYLPSATGSGGISEYDAINTWVPVEGTSASAPIVAALLVRLGVALAVSNDLGFLYTNAAAFNDVTSGTDGIGAQTLCPTGDVICNAAAGWDGPTGLGTPNGPRLAALGTDNAANPVTDDAGSGAGDDAGALDDGGPVTILADAGGNGFGSTASAGCSCNAPGSSAPLESTGALVALGALAIVGARRRR